MRSFSFPKEVLAASLYGEEAAEKLEKKFGDRIIDFRPPVVGDLYIYDCAGETIKECKENDPLITFNPINACRYIVRKSVKRFVVSFKETGVKGYPKVGQAYRDARGLFGVATVDWWTAGAPVDFCTVTETMVEE